MALEGPFQLKQFYDSMTLHVGRDERSVAHLPDSPCGQRVEVRSFLPTGSAVGQAPVHRSDRTPLLWMALEGVATTMEHTMLQLCSPHATRIFQPPGTPSHGTPHQRHQPDPLHDGGQQGSWYSSPQVSMRRLSICTEATLAEKLRLCPELAVENR